MPGTSTATASRRRDRGATTTTSSEVPRGVAIGLKVTDDGVPVLTDTVSHTVHAGNSPALTMSTPAASPDVGRG